MSFLYFLSNVVGREEDFRYLRLGQHVQTPGAHFPISGDADQVVSILSAYDIHAVNWMLEKRKGKLEDIHKNKNGINLLYEYITLNCLNIGHELAVELLQYVRKNIILH